MAPSKHHFASNRSGSRTLKSGPRSEDIQPNESINKRQRLPPTVNSVTQNQRARWVGRRPNRFPVTHQKTHSILHEPSGSMRGPPSSTLATLAVPYAQPHCPASTGDTSCQNTAQSVNDIESRQSRLGHTASTPSLPTSESPAPKRRKLEGSPSVEVRDKISTGTIASNFPFSVSSASSETLVSDPRVKVERSDSPELHSKPQLNTSGSKRYAPIPPECRKSHPNHTEARSAWVRKEQEALMRLGLRVVRTFIRFVTVIPPYSSLTCRSLITGKMGWSSTGAFIKQSFWGVLIKYRYQGGHRRCAHRYSQCHRTRTATQRCCHARSPGSLVISPDIYVEAASDSGRERIRTICGGDRSSKSQHGQAVPKSNTSHTNKHRRRQSCGCG